MKKDIIDGLNELFPDAWCELNYNNDYELLINIILSAQTTDNKVNHISNDLFFLYPNFKSLSNANIYNVIEILKPLGLAKIKAKNIINCAKKIIEDYNGAIPNDFHELVKLDGVGSKTANVFLAVYHNVPTFAVDTHVKRVANLLQISNSDNVNIIERDLKKFFEKDDWIRLHHQFIFFGRYVCIAKKPKCDTCPNNVKKYCKIRQI